MSLHCELDDKLLEWCLFSFHWFVVILSTTCSALRSHYFVEMFFIWQVSNFDILRLPC